MVRFPTARLIFTDTDSLYYFVETEDLEKTLYEDPQRDNWLDYSDYPEGHPYRNQKNRMVIGMFKCETRGTSILEIVGLRPKMYSYIFKDENPTKPLKEKIRIKGISRAAAKTLHHQMYCEQLGEAKENYLTNRRIGSNLHQIYSISVCSALNCLIILFLYIIIYLHFSLYIFFALLYIYIFYYERLINEPFARSSTCAFSSMMESPRLLLFTNK